MSKKFEYATWTNFILKKENGEWGDVNIPAVLKRFGEQGWELVSTEMFDEHIKEIAPDIKEVEKENGEFDYVDTGKKFLMEYDQKKIVYFLKREISDE